MMMVFYLDDYNLISVSSDKNLLYENIKVLFNNFEIPFKLENNEGQVLLRLEKDYEDTDEVEVEVEGIKYSVVPRFIVQKPRFEEEYRVDLDRLGSYVIGNKTIFDLWSPLSKKAYVVIDGREKEMMYLGKGLFELVINDNKEFSLYHYKTVRERIYEFKDPFSYVDEGNNSYVLNYEKFNKVKIDVIRNKTTSIYEVNVRDFSSGNNLPFKNPKKLLALTENGLKLDDKPIGLDYLKSLGVSHIQLMPIFSFDLDGGEYNWGYNPLAYNTIEKSYLISDDPYEQINEVKYVINVLHKNNLRVNLDVVFNHVYKPYRFALDSMLPYYFFRYKGNKLANGSLCGNETRTESYFFREYLKILVRRFITVYDIDGLRFDLMGLIDNQTILEIKEEAKSLKRDFMIYGEGWKMSEVLEDDKMATFENARVLKDIAFFNGHFRDILRGGDYKDNKAYLFGDISKTNEVKELIKGSLSYGLDNNQSINYVECHDNYTMYDKALSLLKDEDLARKVAKLALSLVVLSKGIPFIHSGQEFLRTKKGIDNTYNLPDEINALDWYQKNVYEDITQYLKTLLKIRDGIIDVSGIDYVSSFEEYYEVLIWHINDISIFINPCIFNHVYSSEDTYRLVFDERGLIDDEKKDFDIPCFSVVIGIKN